MAFTPMGDFTFNHTDNIDKPNKAASTNKTEFDSRGAELKTALNNAIALLNATADGASGADNIGMTAIAEAGAGTNIQAVVEGLVARLKAVTDGASGADLVGATAISGVTGTTVQSQMESIKVELDKKALFTSTNKTYRYGFKAQDNHLIFTYEEVV